MSVFFKNNTLKKFIFLFTTLKKIKIFFNCIFLKHLRFKFFLKNNLNNIRKFF